MQIKAGGEFRLTNGVLKVKTVNWALTLDALSHLAEPHNPS